jgi:hypothetical protein
VTEGRAHAAEARRFAKRNRRDRTSERREQDWGASPSSHRRDRTSERREQDWGASPSSHRRDGTSERTEGLGCIPERGSRLERQALCGAWPRKGNRVWNCQGSDFGFGLRLYFGFRPSDFGFGSGFASLGFPALPGCSGGSRPAGVIHALALGVAWMIPGGRPLSDSAERRFATGFWASFEIGPFTNSL